MLGEHFVLFIAVMLAGIAMVGCQPAANTSDVNENESATAPNGSSASSSENSSTSEDDPKSAPQVLIIDVRSKEEWETGHLSQAIHIPHAEIGEKIGEHASDKSTEIVLYSKSGGRAGIAKDALQELGYTNVENAGGYEDILARYPED